MCILGCLKVDTQDVHRLENALIITTSIILIHIEILDTFQETIIDLICQITDTLKVMEIKIKEITQSLQKNQNQIMLNSEIHQL